MKEKENMNIAFMGGSIDIRAQGSFVNQKTGEIVKYGPKVILSGISDEKGTIKPGVFLAMIEAVTTDEDAMSALQELADWKQN